MKINPVQAYKTIQQSSLAGKNNIRSNNKSTAYPQNDQVTVSDEARLLSAALKSAKEVGDVRTEKVMQLQAQIRNGSYHVEASDVADHMLKGAMTYDENGYKKP
jgi:negative regulator of flagellin synthesis FlgM